MENRKSWLITDFVKGLITGVVGTSIIFGIIFAFQYKNKRDKERLEYAEKQVEIEAVREDYRNRDPDEFLEIPDVRRAADGAAAEFERKRDEALQRFRSKFAN
jgi:hypothetical protein